MGCERQADLVGYALGLLDEQERRGVESAFADAAALERAVARVRALLSPLQTDRVEIPAGLGDRILRRVEHSQTIIPIRPLATGATARADGSSTPLRLRELVGLAAAVAVFVGILVPGYQTARRAAQLTACGNNLRIAGGGYAAYAETNNNYWPYAGPTPVNATWLPNAAGVSAAPNSRHAYQLVRGGFAPAHSFVCPGRPGDFAIQAASPRRYLDFPDPRNNSYATNFVGSPTRREEDAADMPLAADMTPIVDENRRLIQDRLPPDNSASHAAGQNVLRSNLSVQFSRTPLLRIGADQDDIYRLQGVEHYTGRERPRLRSDAFLVP